LGTEGISRVKLKIAHYRSVKGQWSKVNRL
jgi:hypothetical protein